MPLIKRIAYLSVIVVVLVPVAMAADDSPSALWAKFEATRRGTTNLHQEFEITLRQSSPYRESLSRQEIVVDLAQSKWREQSVGGSSDLTRIFDGQDVLLLDADGAEYKRASHGADKDEPLPEPYATKVDWGKAKELQRVPCGFSGEDHPCAIIEAPVKPWMRPSTPGDVTTMTNGMIRIMIDTETGIWLRSQMTALVAGPIASSQAELSYTIKQMSYGAAPDLSLFKVPAGLEEVHDFKPWDEGRIKKELEGKAAPPLRATDMQGNPVSLADLKGKTVLLDFWATWCPPCQADSSSIEKLSQKYPNLQVIGISVSEDRKVVEKYLKKHPHDFPIVLSSENLLPRPYQVEELPTYLVIAPDGTLVTAAEGDQGFGRLRKALEKSGMQTE